MDDELSHLEAELKQLRPLPPSPQLVACVERKLAARSARPALARVPWMMWAALPVAASLAVAVVKLSPPRHTAEAQGPASVGSPAESVAAAPLKPVAAENLLVSASDEGLVTLSDGTPARRERLQYVETITWRNPRTNASLRWSVPREEVRVVPVSFQ